MLWESLNTLARVCDVQPVRLGVGVQLTQQRKASVRLIWPAALDAVVQCSGVFGIYFGDAGILQPVEVDIEDSLVLRPCPLVQLGVLFKVPVE